MDAFTTIELLNAEIAKHGYIADKDLVTTIFLAYYLNKPLLLEGPPGTGKTQIANVLAKIFGNKEPIRLQCYEGLDQSYTLYDWNYKKQLLYIEATKEKQDWRDIQDDIYSDQFLSHRPVLKAILSDKTQVLLIDEIDKSEEDLEALLLEVLSSYQVSIPEIGTIHAKSKPFVVLTSNNQRDLTDATRRRCVYAYIDYPTIERETEIIMGQVPGISDLLATQISYFVAGLRKERLKKHPSISESLDWAQALVKLGAHSLDEKIVGETLNLILKKREDIETASITLDGLLKGVPNKAIRLNKTVKNQDKPDQVMDLPPGDKWDF